MPNIQNIFEWWRDICSNYTKKIHVHILEQEHQNFVIDWMRLFVSLSRWISLNSDKLNWDVWDRSSVISSYQKKKKKATKKANYMAICLDTEKKEFESRYPTDKTFPGQNKIFMDC